MKGGEKEEGKLEEGRNGGWEERRKGKNETERKWGKKGNGKKSVETTHQSMLQIIL